jgi:hypothetical protein
LEAYQHQHHKSLGNCKLKLGTDANLAEWLKLKTQPSSNAGEDVEQEELC